MKTNGRNLTKTAERCNAKLAAAGRDERWVLDTDTESNSVGTWFCGNTGGVMYASCMREYTRELIGARR